jgi:hypothetical protein
MAASPEKWRARWQADFPKGDALSPILIRLEPLASNHITERLFGTLKPELNIAKAMNQRKIMLIDLGGAGRAKMEYGSLLFAKIKQEVFKRADIEDKAKRIPHFVFIDEFETFANPQDFSTVLKMARKYRLSLTLASLSRSELDSQLQNALGIISNYVMFSLNPEDLPYFRHFAPDVASDLPKYHAFYKIGENLEYKSSEKPRDIPETSFAKYIKDKTIADYAPNSQIRTVDNDALHTSTNPHTEGNGNKSEDIPPTGSRGDKTL